MVRIRVSSLNPGPVEGGQRNHYKGTELFDGTVIKGLQKTTIANYSDHLTKKPEPPGISLELWLEVHQLQTRKPKP